MSGDPQQADGDLRVDTAWREAYTSASFNRKLAGIIPAGVYKGFEVTPGEGLSVTVGAQVDSVAAVLVDGKYLLTASMPASVTKTIAVKPGQQSIVLRAHYATQEKTSVAIEAVQGEAKNAVILATLNIPDDATSIDDGMVSYDGREDDVIVTGSDVDSAVGSSIKPATEDDAGVIEIATKAETLEGKATRPAVTPCRLTDWWENERSGVDRAITQTIRIEGSEDFFYPVWLPMIDDTNRTFRIQVRKSWRGDSLRINNECEDSIYAGADIGPALLIDIEANGHASCRNGSFFIVRHCRAVHGETASHLSHSGYVYYRADGVEKPAHPDDYFGPIAAFYATVYLRGGGHDYLITTSKEIEIKHSLEEARIYHSNTYGSWYVRPIPVSEQIKPEVTPAAPDAREDVKGIVQFAKKDEAEGGTAPWKVMSPLSTKGAFDEWIKNEKPKPVPPATESTPGIAKIATEEQLLAGESADTIVTPKGLALWAGEQEDHVDPECAIVEVNAGVAVARETTYLVENPFGNVFVVCCAEAFVGGSWVDCPWVFVAHNGYKPAGVRASYLEGKGIVVRTGSMAFFTNIIGGGGIENGNGIAFNSIKIRIKVVRPNNNDTQYAVNNDQAIKPKARYVSTLPLKNAVLEKSLFFTECATSEKRYFDSGWVGKSAGSSAGVFSSLLSANGVEDRPLSTQCAAFFAGAVKDSGCGLSNTNYITYDSFSRARVHAIPFMDKSFALLQVNNNDSIRSAHRYVEANPFGASSVFCIAEVFVNGVWSETGWSVHTGLGKSCGVRATQLDGEIIIQTGVYICDESVICGSGFGSTEIKHFHDGTRVRVKVWKLKV